MIDTLLKRLQGQGARTQLKRRQLLIIGGVGCALSLGLILLFGLMGASQDAPQKAKPQRVKYDGVGNALPREEVWVNRMEEKADSMRDSNEGLKSQLQAMRKQVELLNQAMQKMGTVREVPPPGPEGESLASLPTLPTPEAQGEGGARVLLPQKFPAASSLAPPSEIERGGGVPLLPPNPLLRGQGEGVENYKRIGAISVNMTLQPSKSVDGFLPAGAHIQGVVVSGVAASTATNAASDPQPIFIRLTSEGIMPRGWSASLLDAQIIGSCYGDLSSERAYCRLETLSYLEPSGEVVEEKLEGWVVGEDGRYGMRGIVVDRADEVARQALVSGILGGMSGFFQAQTASSVFPVSPFGQTNAMKPQDMLKAGGANGVGKALDRLAQFAIDRAEKMSPVILINPGRVVDIVLKKGIDISKTVYRKTLSQARLAKRQQWGQRTALERAKTVEFKGEYQ